MPQLPIQSPIGGVNRVANREGQPPNTCWDALNVLPYDRYGRHRVAQRHGLSKFSSTQLASTKIQGMIQVPGVTYAGTTSSTVLTPLTFSHVPATVSTAGNSISWPANFLPGADPGVVVTSVPAQPWTLQFNLVFTGSSTANAANNLYLSLSNGSTAWNNPAVGNDPVDVQFRYNPQGGSNNITIDLSTNNALGFSDFNNGSTATLPFSSSIPCSLAVDGVGHLTVAFGNLSPVILNIGSTATTSSTLQLWADNPTTGTAISTNSMNFSAASTVFTGQTGYKTMLVTVAGGNVFLSDVSGVMLQASYNGVPSTARISSTAYVSMAYTDGFVFLVDGSSTLWAINTTSTTLNGIGPSTVTSTTAVVSPFATSSTIQAPPPNCSLCVAWRGRIVLAGDSGNPAVWYMSRPQGQYGSTNTLVFAGTEWDYSQTDSAAAIFGNNAGANGIFEPITALIPFSNDYLKFGCSHSMYMAQGDPAGGGNIVCVSQNIGVIGKDAWCVDPAGTLWFVATGGLYSCRPAWEFYRPPEPVTLNSVNSNFTQLDPGIARTTLIFDPDLHYLHVFMSAPPISGTLGQHLTLDARSVGQEGGPAFWPQAFPSTMGPTAAAVFFADGNPNNRTILLGGSDGYVRNWTAAAIDDDGTAISAGITLGPYQLAGPGMAATVQGVTIDLGETPVSLSSTTFGVVVKLAAGPDAYSVTEYLTNAANPKPIAIVGFTLDRRQKTLRQRLRGGWFSINLASGTELEFSFESAVIDFVPSGKNRERRT